jgi:hypothetical protein
MFRNLKLVVSCIALLTGIFVVGVDAQRTKKTISLNPVEPEAQTARLEQCRNGGTVDANNGCNIASAWVTGNVGDANSHWSEAQFVPYRAILDTLPAGTHSIVIAYDAKESGRHALDYLGTYNYTEALADPCVDGVCPAGGSTTKGIPADPYVTSQTNPNSGVAITQIPGVMTLWGGTGAVIDSVVYEGTFTGTATTEERRVRVTFTLPNASNVVFAWGGHIGWQGDWGAGQSAGSLNGSPYHMRLKEIVVNGVLENIGNQDRSLSADAVDVSGGIIIVKRVETVSNTDESTQSFGFTASAFFPNAQDPQNQFSLIDNVAGDGGVSRQSSPIFGTVQNVTVEEAVVEGWTLLDISCNDGDSTGNVLTRTATINVTVTDTTGEIVTCTFVNGQNNASASSASLAGRVLTSSGGPISGATIMIQNLSTGETKYLLTNSYGRYATKGLPVGDFYAVTVMHRRYSFPDPTRYFTLEDNLTDMDFTSR